MTVSKLIITLDRNLTRPQATTETYVTTRQSAASYMRAHPDDFLPFLTGNNDEGDTLSPGAFVNPHRDRSTDATFFRTIPKILRYGREDGRVGWAGRGGSELREFTAVPSADDAALDSSTVQVLQRTDPCLAGRSRPPQGRRRRRFWAWSHADIVRTLVPPI